jgi:hypothetical protein
MAVLLTGRRDARGVGVVRGKVAMSDASGRLRLETLAAKLEETDLMSLSLGLAAREKSEPRVGLKFKIPDLARLASALGRKASEGVRIAFDGMLGAADGAATVKGSGRIGRTDLAGWLRIAAPEGTPEIMAKISAEDLHLSDLTTAREVSELFADRKLEAAVRELGLEQVFRRLGKAPAASGPLDLDLAVSAQGTDLNALLASMSGQVSGSIRGGSLADRTINLAGQTIVEWVFTRTADGSAPLVCLVARFDFKDGIAAARQLVLETDKVQAAGGGTLNLRDETMDLVFQPRPKRNDLVGEVGPVGVSGPLSRPEIKVAKGTVAAKVVGETIGLPFHLLRPILGADGRALPGHEPCVVIPDKK